MAAVSVQDLRPNSQDISAFYLANIYQVLADPNTSSTPTLVKPPVFSPPSYAIWVNSLWFLSLVVSLTCALLATLLKQWARRYVSVTQPPRYSPHKRARIRAFCADGVDKLHLPWAVAALPAMLHLSLFLFFAGLLIFLSNINHTAFNVTAWWIGLSAAVYISVTIMPIFRHDSPYYAPLSTSVWTIYHGIAYLALQTRWLIQYRGVRILGDSAATRLFLLKVHCLERFLGGIRKAVETTAWRLSAEIDSRVLEWTFDALDEDHEIERFFEGIPGLYDSRVLKDPQKALVAKLGLGKISSTLMGLLDRTHASNLASESAKQRQLIICVKAARAMRLPQVIPRILQTTFLLPWNWVLQSVEMGHALKNMSNDTDVEIALFARAIVAGIVAGVRERDTRWFTLALRQLGIPDRVLRAYLAHGDSVLLANLIHITRHIFFSLFGISRELAHASSIILQSLSKFDIQGTLPELQHDFCALWNEIAQEARGSGRFTAPVHILRHTRHIYIALHQGTDAAPTAFSPTSEAHDDSLYEGSSYPLCNIPGHHRSEPIRHIHELVLVDRKAIPSTAPHHDTTLTTVAPSDFPSFPIPDPSLGSPGHTDESLQDGVPDARRCFIPITTSSHTAPESFHRDCLPTSSFETTTADLTKDIADIPPTTNPIPLSAISGAIVSQQLEATPIALPCVVNSPSSPIPFPRLRVDPYSSSDSAEIDVIRLPHEQVSTPASSSVPPQVSPVPARIVSTSAADVGVLDHSQDLSISEPSQMELSHHSRPSSVSP